MGLSFNDFESHCNRAGTASINRRALFKVQNWRRNGMMAFRPTGDLPRRQSLYRDCFARDFTPLAAVSNAPVAMAHKATDTAAR